MEASKNVEKRHIFRYAVLGVFVAVMLCLVWTCWLLCLTLDPNATINRLMDTTELDAGLFWLFGELPPTVRGLGACGLAAVTLTHTSTLVQLVLHYLEQRKTSHILIPVAPLSTKQTETKSAPSSGIIHSRKLKQFNSFRRRANRVSATMLDPQSTRMRVAAVVLKLSDLALQCVVLTQLMNNGLAPFLVVGFAACIVSNALWTAAIVSISHIDMGSTHLVIDFIFDMIVTVVFPLLVLATAIATFSFDHQLMLINDSVFPIGSFERAASVIANPVEIMRIRFAIDAFRINSLSKVFTRVGTNIALCFRSYKLSQLIRRDFYGDGQPSIYPARNRGLGFVFVAIAVVVAVFTERAITTSAKACAPHVECALFAHTWVTSTKYRELTYCPCIALVDRDVSVGRFEDWIHPVNRTEKIARLATSGRLQAIQIVNRDVSHLPEELLRCTGLRYLSLYYTGNLTLPDWFRDFTRLEFLHIEGGGVQRSLQPLHEGLFDDMQSLALIHLASHTITRLPSFDSLTGLKSINLAVLRKLETVPRFDSLVNLERLVFNSMTELQTIPNLDHAQKLSTFISFDRGAYCCNGFLGPDRCNLSHSLCKTHPLFKTPAITQCLPPSMQASKATRAVFDQFWETACYDEALRPGDRKASPTRYEMELCEGIMYRECRLPGVNASAMCYNTRWMGIACDPSPFAIEMRRRQIKQQLGTPCDPRYEAWLGCSTK